MGWLAGPTTGDVWDDYSTSVVRVEEDWELIVKNPDWNVAAPQVATQMKRWEGSSRFFNLHLNAVDLPKLALGGMQLQAWQGTNNLASTTSANNDIMNTPNEVVSWTQYLWKKPDGKLYFGVSTASSETWGDFSGQEVQMPTGNTNLDEYSPSYSASYSGITFGANRVASFKLLRVRVLLSDGAVVTDNTTRAVYTGVVSE
jgi:hypothetical protein